MPPPSLHKNLPPQHVHQPHSFEYANATARNAATGFIAEDVGKWAFEIATGTYWRLQTVTPTWLAVGGGGGVTAHGALTGLGNDDHGQYLLLSPLSSARNVVQPLGDFIPMTLMGTPGSTVDLFQIKQGGVTPTTVVRVDPTGKVFAPSAFVQPALSSVVPLTLRGVLSQSVPLLQVQEQSLGGASSVGGLLLTMGSSGAGSLQTTDHSLFLPGGHLWLAREMRFGEVAVNGTFYVGFRSPDNLDGSQIYVLPPQDGALGQNQVLSTSGGGGGVLSWVNASGITAHGSLTGLTGSDDHTQYLFNAPASSARNLVTPTGNFTALTLKGAASQAVPQQIIELGATQTGNFLEGRDAGASTPKWWVDTLGVYQGRGLTLFGSGTILGNDQGHQILMSPAAGVNQGFLTLNPVTDIGDVGRQGVMVPKSPFVGTNYGLFSLGPGPWNGTTVGFFAGSAAGTYLAGNAATAYVGNWIDLQRQGARVFRVAGDGQTTIQALTGMIKGVAGVLQVASPTADYEPWLGNPSVNGQVLSSTTLGVRTWITPSGGGGVTAHSALTGLGADDHAQYFLLAGRAGGQVGTGGTAAGENLTWRTTVHPTKGKLLIGSLTYDESNNLLGLNQSSPAHRLHITNVGNVWEAIRIDQTITSAGATAPDFGPLSLRTTYTATDVSSGFDLAHTGIDSRLFYGTGTPTVKGTGHTFTSVLRVDNSGSTSNEWANYMGWQRIDNNSVGRSWFADFSMHGPIGAVPNLLTGVTMLLNAYHGASSPTSGPSANLLLVTVPAQGAGLDGTSPHLTTATTPVDLALGIMGFAGTQGAPVLGIKKAIQIGGFAPNWMTPAQSSRIGIGIHIQDLSDKAIMISGGNTGIQWGLDSDTGYVRMDRASANLLQIGQTSPSPGARLRIAFPEASNAGGFTIGTVNVFANSQTITSGSDKMELFISGGAGNFSPGSLAGDVGILASNGRFLLGKDGATNPYITVKSGRVGIGIGTADPQASTSLELGDATMALRLSRPASTGAITTPVSAMLIYDAGFIKYYDGSIWQTLSTGSGTGVSAHGALTGLGNDDHLQYLNINGRAGGQIARGGTGPTDTLTWMSTANATKTKILFGTSGYDEANNRLGIGTQTPQFKLDVADFARVFRSTAPPRFRVETDTTDDALIEWLIPSVRSWVMGIDNSDSDRLKISSVDDGFLNPVATFALLGTDPLVQFGSTGASDAVNFMLKNGSGEITEFVSGGVNNYMTGTAQGDVGIRIASGKKLHVGVSGTSWGVWSNAQFAVGTTTPLGGMRAQLVTDAVMTGVDGTAHLALSAAANVNKRMVLGFDPVQNVGFINAGESGVSMRDIVLNQTGGNVNVGTPLQGARLGVVGTNSTGTVGVKILKGTSSSSALDVVLDATFKALRVFPSAAAQPNTYLDDAGGYYSTQEMVLSGSSSGVGDAYAIFPATADPTHLSINAVLNGPAIQVKAAAQVNSYLFSGLDRSGNYTVALEEDGSLRMGAGTRAAMDVRLFRSAGNTVRSDNIWDHRGQVRMTLDGATPDVSYPSPLTVTRAVAAGQYLTLVRALTTAYSVGMLPNSNVFGIGAANVADASWVPNICMDTSGRALFGRSGAPSSGAIAEFWSDPAAPKAVALPTWNNQTEQDSIAAQPGMFGYQASSQTLRYHDATAWRDIAYVSQIISLHAALTGLEADDHPGYFWQAGRTSFAQALIGSTQPGGDVFIQSTSHGIKGLIQIGNSAYNDGTQCLGIRTTNPVYGFDCNADARFLPSLTGMSRLALGVLGTVTGFDVGPNGSIGINATPDNAEANLTTNGIRFNFTGFGTNSIIKVPSVATLTLGAVSRYIRVSIEGDANQYALELKVISGAVSPPFAPTVLSALAISSSQINLGWTDNSSDETAFLIERAPDGTTFTQISSVNPNVVTFQNTGLAPSTQYWYRVRSTNTGGNSAYSNIANATTSAAATVPANPTVLSALAISSSQINLNWTDNAGNETGFLIERSPLNNGAFAQVASVGVNVTTYQDTGLSASTLYFYRVRATNAVGNSGYTNEASATTSAAGGAGISDDFNRPNVAGLMLPAGPTGGQSGLTWTVVDSAGNASQNRFGINSNRAIASLAGVNYAGAYLSGQSDSGTAKVTLPVGVANQAGGLMFRYDPSTKTAYVLNNFNVSEWRVYYVNFNFDTGAFYQEFRGGFNGAPADGAVIEAIMTSGSSAISYRINGTLYASGSIGGAGICANNTTLANHGIYADATAVSGGINIRFDDYLWTPTGGGGGGSIVDDFNRANSSTTLGTSSGGQLWVPRSGTWGISSNQAYCPVGGGPNAVFAALAGQSVDATVEVTMPVLSTDIGGLFVRRNDSDNTSYVIVNRSSQWRVYQWTGAAYGALLGSFGGVAPAAGHRIKCVLSGTTGTFFLDTGGGYGSGTAFTLSSNATSNEHGLVSDRTAGLGNMRWDNYNGS